MSAVFLCAILVDLVSMGLVEKESALFGQVPHKGANLQYKFNIAYTSQRKF